MADDAAVLEPTIIGEDGKQKVNPEWQKQRNENVAAQRAGKPVQPPLKSAEQKAAETKPAEAKTPGKPEDVKPVEDGDEKDGAGGQRVSPGIRREMNRLQRLVGELTGRNAVLQELIDKGLTPKQAEAKVAAAEAKADAEPQRKDFPEGAAGEAEYLKAVAKHAGKSEAEKGTKEREEQEALRHEIVNATAAAIKDKDELFPDWDEVAARQDENAPTWQDFPPGDKRHIEDGGPVRPVLSLMLAKSPLRARYAYHFKQHPEELEAMLEHADGSNEQIRAFERLGGKLEVIYKSKEKEQKTDKAAASAEGAAKLHKPSQAIAPKSGSAVEIDIPMTIEKDGRQIVNPAWQRIRNERAGVRQ